MIPAFLLPLALKLSPVGRFIKAVPRSVWIVLAVIAILLLGTCAHKRAVKKFGDERYAAGVRDEDERITKKALAIKAKADAASAKISAAFKEKNNEENRSIARSADNLRLRGAGKSACPAYSRVASGPGGPIAPGGAKGASATGLPVEDRIAVPFGWAVDQAERCDMNRAEVLAWRSWHEAQSKAWAKMLENER